MLKVLNAHKLSSYTWLIGRHTAGEQTFSEAPITVIDNDDFLLHCTVGRLRQALCCPAPGDQGEAADALQGAVCK